MRERSKKIVSKLIDVVLIGTFVGASIYGGKMKQFYEIDERASYQQRITPQGHYIDPKDLQLSSRDYIQKR